MKIMKKHGTNKVDKQASYYLYHAYCTMDGYHLKSIGANLYKLLFAIKSASVLG